MNSNSPWKDNRWLPGVLNKDQMLSLMDAHLITDADRASIGWDASALDLHLTSEGYEMIRGSVKPCNKTYREILSDRYYSERLIPKDGISFRLEKGHCYLFVIKEKFHPYIKSTPIFGQATAKSSIGRVDVIARLIVDGMKEYEKFSPSKINSGEMFIEITPITFNVVVRENLSISQLRFFYGEIEDSIISSADFIRSVLHVPDGETNDGTLAVDLSNTLLNGSPEQAAAFCAKENDNPIELWKKDNNSDRYAQQEYWKYEPSTDKDNLKSIIIDTNNFYILRSIERISLNESVCIYCRAMDETLGEMRIHYAGFVHPCFGDSREDSKTGTPLIFEVRGHNVKILLTHNEILARLFFYRMSKNVVKPPIGSTSTSKKVSYNEQELNLSTLFQERWA